MQYARYPVIRSSAILTNTALKPVTVFAAGDRRKKAAEVISVAFSAVAVIAVQLLSLTAVPLLIFQEPLLRSKLYVVIFGIRLSG